MEGSTDTNGHIRKISEGDSIHDSVITVECYKEAGLERPSLDQAGIQIQTVAVVLGFGKKQRGQEGIVPIIKYSA